MTENKEETKPIGVVVTLREIHEAVGRIEDTLTGEITKLKDLFTGEITKLKIRIAAHEVIIGMMTVTIIFLVQKGLS